MTTRIGSIERGVYASMCLAACAMALMAAAALWSERGMLIRERADGTRQQVELANGLLAHFHGLAVRGELQEQHAKEAAIAIIQRLPEAKTGNLWIRDNRAQFLFAPKSVGLNDIDLDDFLTSDGQLSPDAQRAIAGASEENVVHPRRAGNSSASVATVSYIKHFDPWGWTIGCADSLETVDDRIERRAIAYGLAMCLIMGILHAAARTFGRPLTAPAGRGEAPSKISADD